MASDKEIEKLEKMGWVVNCTSPFEAYHDESNSSVTGHMGKILLLGMLEQEEKDKKLEDLTHLQEFVQNGVIDRETFVKSVTKILFPKEQYL